MSYHKNNIERNYSLKSLIKELFFKSLKYISSGLWGEQEKQGKRLESNRNSGVMSWNLPEQEPNYFMW